MVEKIKQGRILFAIIIRNKFKKKGITFFTPNKFSQQLAYMRRPKGHIIPRHYHNTIKRQVLYTQETLIIKKGKVMVTFYDKNKNVFKQKILNKGDVILMAFGGHGFKMLKETEIIEVKQGPFAGELDKIRF